MQKREDINIGRLKKYVGKETTGLSCLLVPLYMNADQSNEQEEFLVNREEIEKNIIAHNSRHLHQAHASKVVQSGCVEQLRSIMVQSEILKGKYRTNTDEGFNRIAQGLNRRMQESDHVVSQEVLTRTWSRAKGGKSSVNKVFLYAVIKCLSKSDILMKHLAWFYTKIIDNRIVLRRWSKAIAVMLEKGKGLRIDKLRIIQLIEADLQMLMRTIISPVANKVVYENQLNPSRYARKFTTTMNTLVEKCLVLESSMLNRDKSVWVVSDMTACYDRHIKEVGEVILQMHGVNAYGAKILLKNLAEMKTHIQTSFSLSKEGYRSTREQVHYGTGQENIVSVFICQFGTSCIFYMLDE